MWLRFYASTEPCLRKKSGSSRRGLLVMCINEGTMNE